MRRVSGATPASKFINVFRGLRRSAGTFPDRDVAWRSSTDRWKPAAEHPISLAKAEPGISPAGNGDRGGDDGDQWYRARVLDRFQLRARPRILSQAAAVSRAEAGDRHGGRPITASADGPRSGSARRQPSIKARHSSRSVSACIICASAPASAPTSMSCTIFDDTRRQDHPCAARGSMGAGILFDFVRGSRRHQAGAQSCAGEGVLGLTKRRKSFRLAENVALRVASPCRSRCHAA